LTRAVPDGSVYRNDSARRLLQKMWKNSLAFVVLALQFSNAAQAGVFDVPYENPALTITVPARWSPNHSDEGVDAAAPDNSAFFSIYTMDAVGSADVQRDSLAILTRNGMHIEKKPISEQTLSFSGLNWVEQKYSATEDGKPAVVQIDAAPLAGKRYVQLLIWGAPEGIEKNAGNLKKIFGTIKLVKK
jgi:hypothetical protein